MSILRRFTKARTIEESFSTLTSPKLYTTLRPTTDQGMRQSVAWACIRLRAETLGMLPIGVVEYDGATRIPAGLPTWLQKPNAELTRFELFERTSASLDTDGNSFWYLVRDNLARLREVYLLPPAAVRIDREKRPDGTLGPKRFTYSREEYGTDEILHIPGFTLPGRMRGLSPIQQHAHAIGLAIAAEEFGEAYFNNGSVMSGVITADRDPGPDNAERMRNSFARDHQGRRNAHKPGFLFNATWTPLSIPNDQAQFLETRKFQSEEIARIFRVPAHKVNILEHATFSNIEHQAIEWVQDGVMPYTARIEAAVLAAGLLDDGQHMRFNLAGLLRGDTLSRYAAYNIGRNGGWLNVDDIRALEDWNALPDGMGQTYLQPLNMQAVGEDDGTLIDKVNAAGVLVRAGYDPAAALVAVGLDPIRHLGLLPVTVQPED